MEEIAGEDDESAKGEGGRGDRLNGPPSVPPVVPASGHSTHRLEAQTGEAGRDHHALRYIVAFAGGGESGGEGAGTHPGAMTAAAASAGAAGIRGEVLHLGLLVYH